MQLIMVCAMLANDIDDDDGVAKANVYGDDADFYHDDSVCLCKCLVLVYAVVVLLNNRHVYDASRFPFPNRPPSPQSHRLDDRSK